MKGKRRCRPVAGGVSELRSTQPTESTQPDQRLTRVFEGLLRGRAARFCLGGFVGVESKSEPSEASESSSSPADTGRRRFVFERGAEREAGEGAAESERSTPGEDGGRPLRCSASPERAQAGQSRRRCWTQKPSRLQKRARAQACGPGERERSPPPTTAERWWSSSPSSSLEWMGSVSVHTLRSATAATRSSGWNRDERAERQAAVLPRAFREASGPLNPVASETRPQQHTSPGGASTATR